MKSARRVLRYPGMMTTVEQVAARMSTIELQHVRRATLTFTLAEMVALAEKEGSK